MDIYHHFAKDICDEGYLNFDQTSKEQIYVWETFGRKKYLELFGTNLIDKNNGYVHGKSWMDITISMWKEDISNYNNLHPFELLDYDKIILKKL